jgi:hypothetical protein
MGCSLTYEIFDIELFVWVQWALGQW